MVDETPRIGGFGGIEHHVILGLGIAVLEVEAQIALEKHRLLQGNAHDLAQIVLGKFADVDAVDGDAAFGDVVEAGDQVDQGALARPGGAQKAHLLARFDGQIDILEGRWIEFSVRPPEGKGYVLKADVALDLFRLLGLDALLVQHGGLGIERFEDTLRRHVAAQHQGDDDGHQRQGRDDQRHIGIEGAHLAHGHACSGQDRASTGPGGQDDRQLADPGQQGGRKATRQAAA